MNFTRNIKPLSPLSLAACALVLAAAMADGAPPSEKAEASGTRPRATKHERKDTRRESQLSPRKTTQKERTVVVRAPVRTITSERVAVLQPLESIHYRIQRTIFRYPVPVPYLVEGRSPEIRVERKDPFYRRPPLLPKIISPAVQTTTDSGAGQTAPVDGLLPDEESAEKKPMDEVVDFFRDSGERSGSEKGLGEQFDPTFAPVPVPPQPPSSATYRRE